MKAGVLELPDVFVVNKADLGAAARRTRSELESSLALAETGREGWIPPVVSTSARDGIGIAELVDALAEHRAHALAKGRLAERRREGAVRHVIAALRDRYGSYGLDALGGEARLRERLAHEPELLPFHRAETLAREVEDALAKPRVG